MVAGKTRSGKTTGVIALLIQVLSYGPDDFGSTITIVDPKCAELSRLPFTVTLDDDGEATGILDALKAYVAIITRRQKFLNDLSEQTGDAVKWWDADFHPSFLFWMNMSHVAQSCLKRQPRTVITAWTRLMA